MLVSYKLLVCHRTILQCPLHAVFSYSINVHSCNFSPLVTSGCCWSEHCARRALQRSILRRIKPHVNVWRHQMADATYSLSVVFAWLRYAVKNIRISARMFCGLHCRLWLRHFADLRIWTYTEPVPLEYGKLATKCPRIYGYFFTVYAVLCFRNVERCMSREFFTSC